MSLLRRIEGQRPAGQQPAAPAPGAPPPPAGSAPTPPKAPPEGPLSQTVAPARDLNRDLRVRLQTRIINNLDPRLDLSDAHAKEAKRHGIPIVISTDTHVRMQLDFMAYGVSIARRGWLEKKDVLNTLPAASLLTRLGAMRAARGSAADPPG